MANKDEYISYAVVRLYNSYNYR